MSESIHHCPKCPIVQRDALSPAQACTARQPFGPTGLWAFVRLVEEMEVLLLTARVTLVRLESTLVRVVGLVAGLGTELDVEALAYKRSERQRASP